MAERMHTSRGALRTALIGCGRIAQVHLAGLASIADAELVGVCDLSRALADAAADRYGVARAYTDHRALLRETLPDVVHVTTPAATHPGLVTDALEAGAHVIVEKPAAVDLADVERMVELARRRERVLLEDYNYLFNDGVQQILAWQRSGALGDVVHVDVSICLGLLREGSSATDRHAPHPSLGLPGGPILEFVTHLACLAELFVGPLRNMHTVWSKREPDSPLPHDELRALAEAERGTASLSFSAHAQPDRFVLRVEGSRMLAEAHLFEPRLASERIRESPKPLQPFVNGIVRGRDEVRSAFRSVRRKLAGGPGAYEGQWALMRAAYEALRGRRELPISADQILSVNRWVATMLAGSRA